MNTRLFRWATVVLGSFVLALAGCGGDSDDDSSPPPPASTTTDVSTKVVDGAIGNALVCLDKNGNGLCDAGEPQARSAATTGIATLTVDNADVGHFPIIARVGAVGAEQAVDADHGPVTTAFVLTAPADQAALVSPLTTLVQRAKADNGSTTAEAAKLVQDSSGLLASPLADYTAAGGSPSAATLARFLVVTTQTQATAIAATLGTTAIDGAVITQADLDKAIQKKVLELLPDLSLALTAPAVVNAAPADKEAALQAAATTVVTSSGLTPAGTTTAVAVNNQAASTAPVTPVPPAAANTLNSLSYSDASTYFVRVLTSSLAQATPDSANTTRYVDRRARANTGRVAKWGTGANPAGQADIHWTGTAWAACPINYASTSGVRDAGGTAVYEFCNNFETGKSTRASFDITGKTMASVYSDARAAGYTNLFIAEAAVTGLLGSAVFPAGSTLFLQSNTPTSNAFAYYPGSPYTPGQSSIYSFYTPAVSAGGVAASQPAGQNCNSAETSTNGANATTLEQFIASKTGTPCVYGQGNFVYGGVTYFSDPNNEWWGNSTANIGVIGTAPLNSGTAPGYYSGNTVIRYAFTGTGTNPVTYYACKQRFTDGSSRNCTPIGTGTYAIATLGDARVLTLANAPQQTAAFNYSRVAVERGGYVYAGYQTKPAVTLSARMNTIATVALLTQLGLTPEDPAVPLALTQASYQGSWDVTDTVAGTTVTTLFINGNGNVSCQDRTGTVFSAFFACSVTITDPATGTFDYSDATGTASGTFEFLSGNASGTYNDSSSVPPTGSFIGHRR